jgi:hypothetical protein
MPHQQTSVNFFSHLLHDCFYSLSLFGYDNLHYFGFLCILAEHLDEISSSVAMYYN